MSGLFVNNECIRLLISGKHIYFSMFTPCSAKTKSCITMNTTVNWLKLNWTGLVIKIFALDPDSPFFWLDTCFSDRRERQGERERKKKGKERERKKGKRNKEEKGKTERKRTKQNFFYLMIHKCTVIQLIILCLCLVISSRDADILRNNRGKTNFIKFYVIENKNFRFCIFFV